MRKNLNETPAHELAGLTIDLMSKLRDNVISITELKKFLTTSSEKRKEIFGVEKLEEQQENQFLKLISGNESITIPYCDGAETIDEISNVFSINFDGEFDNWRKPSVATGETQVEVYELVKDAAFVQMFGRFGTDLDKLCFTLHQIKMFYKRHQKWFRTDGFPTFFLCKKNNHFFVYCVKVKPGYLNIEVSRIGYGYVWSVEHDAPYLILPQQES